MASFPENPYTVDVIGEFVDRIRAVEAITNITNPSGNTWLIETSLTHTLRNGQYVVIDGTAYAVANVIQDVSFEITSTTPVVSSQWKAEAPYYYHGTPIKINEAIVQQKPDTRKFPMVCLFEIFDDHKKRDVEGNKIKSPECRLFFMDDAQTQSSSEQHHVNKVQPMEDLEELFLDELVLHPFIGEIKTEFTSRPRADWGVFLQNVGNDKRIINWKLSGVELQLRIPIEVGFGGCNDTRPISCPSYCDLTDSLDPSVSGACINASPNLAGIQAEICVGGGGDVTIEDSAGGGIAVVPAPATYNVADSPITSSGGNFNDAVLATATYVIADNTYTDSDGSGKTEEYGTNIVCELHPAIMDVDFESDIQTVVVGNTVVFTDLSTLIPTNYCWDFGDGESDFAQNPSHTWALIGDYTIALLAGKTGFGNLETKIDFITVIAAAFPNLFSFRFTGLESINIPNSTAFAFGSGDFLISAKINRSGINERQMIIAKEGNTGARQFSLSITAENKFQILYFTSASTNVNQKTSTTFSSTSTNYHVMVQKRTILGVPTFQIYVNAVLQPMEALSGTHGTMFSASVALRLGMRLLTGFPDMLKADSDENNLWNTSMNQSEIDDFYNSGNALDLLTHSKAANLVGWWRMGDGATFGTQWTVPDASTNNNTGTSIAMVLGSRVAGL